MIPLQLRSSEFFDFDSPEVSNFIDCFVPDDAISDSARAVSLFYAVRDQIQYEVYGADLSREGLRASAIVRAGSGMCLHKSILYVACLRRLGVGARLSLADVRNHITSERLRIVMGGDVFKHHCYAVIELNGKWIKVTPVFSKKLCNLFGILPLEFDGKSDSVFHPFDAAGRRHMEFLRQHGEFDDVPYEMIIADLRTAHPRLFSDGEMFTAGSLAADAVDDTNTV